MTKQIYSIEAFAEVSRPRLGDGLTTIWKISVPLLALLLTMIVFTFLEFSPLRFVENYYTDRLILSHEARATSTDDIVIVELRESSLENLAYRSPIDRDFMASLIEKLVSANAKAIGVDFLFDQPTELEKDKRLRAVLEKSADKVVVATGTAEDGLTEAQVAFQESYLEGIPTASVVLAKDWQDGIVRHYDRGSNPQFAWQIAGKSEKLDERMVSRILYRLPSKGQQTTFSTYPAEAALVLPSEWFEGKYVLLGTNLPNVDQFRTPFVAVSGEQSGTIPGVRIHGHVLAQVLSDKEVRETGLLTKLAVILAASISGLLLVLNPLPVWMRLIGVISAMCAMLFLGWIVFSYWLLLFPAAAGCVSMMIATMVASMAAWQQDLKEKRFIRQAWSHYVNKEVVDDLIRNPDHLRTGGERVEASFVFTDIAGFTTLSEKLPADKLGEVINGYLDVMVAEFNHSGATLDKIVGDAIVGFFGAPVPHVEHPDKAVALALKLQEVSKEYEARMLEQGIEFGQTRVGVNTGTATVGNSGGSTFFDYTALGDAVNTASRLEAVNKYIGSGICVSGDTARRAIKHIFRPVGHLYVEGKSNSVEAWEPVSESGTEHASLSAYQEAYHAMDNDPDMALGLFRNLKKEYPEDHLVAFHTSRLENGKHGTVIEMSK